MITNQDKINIIINRLNNLEAIKESFIQHAEMLTDKYSLEEELLDCNAKKSALLEVLNELGGSWPIS